MASSRWASLFLLRVAPPPIVRRLLGVGGIAVVVLLWWIATAGADPETRLVSPVILPSPREVLSSFPSLLKERALVQSVAATLQRVLIGFGLAALVGVPLGTVAGSGGGAAGDRGRLVARLRRIDRAARLVRSQPSRRRADSSHYLVVRDRRSTESDVHFHCLRALRVLRCRASDHQRPGPLRGNRSDARRVAAADCVEGPCGARAAWHLQKAPAPGR